MTGPLSSALLSSLVLQGQATVMVTREDPQKLVLLYMLGL